MTGPRFIPFEAMTDAEQREHLAWWHGWGSWRIEAELPGMVEDHADDHDSGIVSPLARTHTHECWSPFLGRNEMPTVDGIPGWRPIPPGDDPIDKPTRRA